MKKFVTVIMALAMIFALVLPAMADEVCPPCEKCGPIELGCPSGETQGESAQCVYGSDYWVRGLDNNGMPMLDDCPVIFQVCNCDDPNQFTAGKVVGIRMRILVNGQEGDNGAYFANFYSGNIIMSNYQEFLCDPSCTNPKDANAQGIAQAPPNSWWCDTNDNGQIDAGEAVWRAANFNVLGNGFDYYNYVGGEYRPGATPSGSCNQGTNNRVVQIMNKPNEGITIRAFDDTWNLSKWAIDIPPIVITPAISECSTISVEICLMVGSAGGICGDCQCVCSCVYDLYQTCCWEENYCLLFPFVAFTSTGWNAGVGLSDVNAFSSSTSVNRTVTFMFVPEDGQVSTWTDTGVGAIKTYSFGTDILPNLDPAPTSTIGELKVITNYNVHGMLYLTNGVFGAAHLGACCYGPCGGYYVTIDHK